MKNSSAIELNNSTIKTSKAQILDYRQTILEQALREKQVLKANDFPVVSL